MKYVNTVHNKESASHESDNHITKPIRTHKVISKASLITKGAEGKLPEYFEIDGVDMSQSTKYS